MPESMANHMETIILFEEPFLDIQYSERILDNVWRSIEQDHLIDHVRGNKIDTYVSLQEVLCLSWSWMLTTQWQLHDIQSRIRSHLVYETKKIIPILYKFDQNCSLEYIQDRIGWLLKRNHFTCAEVHWEVMFVTWWVTWGVRLWV